jgi:hypothetical protein
MYVWNRKKPIDIYRSIDCVKRIELFSGKYCKITEWFIINVTEA